MDPLTGISLDSLITYMRMRCYFYGSATMIVFCFIVYAFVWDLVNAISSEKHQYVFQIRNVALLTNFARCILRLLISPLNFPWQNRQTKKPAWDAPRGRQWKIVTAITHGYNNHASLLNRWKSRHRKKIAIIRKYYYKYSIRQIHVGIWKNDFYK